MAQLKCEFCGSTKHIMASRLARKMLCTRCIMKRYPPYITLVEFPSVAGPRLWNIEVGKYEEFDSHEDLQICGWQPRMKLYLPNGAIVIHMEFDCSINCGRCADYSFKLIGERCMSAACENMQFKLPEGRRMMPTSASKSFYLQWKYGASHA